MCLSLHVKYPLFLSDFNETWIFLTDFKKYSNSKLQENLSCGSQVFLCGWTDDQANSHCLQLWTCLKMFIQIFVFENSTLKSEKHTQIHLYLDKSMCSLSLRVQHIKGSNENFPDCGSKRI